MYDKDDDIIDTNTQEESAKTPYDFADNFSSPYDSIMDLEKEIEQDTEETPEPLPVSRFNINKLDNNNVIFVASAALFFIVIIGVVVAINKDYVKIPNGLTAIFNKRKNNIEKQIEVEDVQKREINVTEMDDDEIAKILADKNNVKEGDLPDLPPIGQNGEVPTESDIILGRVPNGNVGRMDPFNPVGENSYYDVMAPPMDVTPDVDAQALMTAKVKGIMYTSDSPSAIVNIAGNDQLVKTGDVIDGFRIVRITRDKVTIKTGKNVYSASVGELVSASSVAGVRDVPNLKRKFAGPYSGGGRIIEINSTN